MSGAPASFDGQEMRSLQTTVQFIRATREASCAQENIRRNGRIPTVREVKRANQERSGDVEYPTRIPTRE